MAFCCIAHATKAGIILQFHISCLNKLSFIRLNFKPFVARPIRGLRALELISGMCQTVDKCALKGLGLSDKRNDVKLQPYHYSNICKKGSSCETIVGNLLQNHTPV